MNGIDDNTPIVMLTVGQLKELLNDREVPGLLESEFISAREAAMRLRVSRQTIRRWVKKGYLNHAKVVRNEHYYRTEDIDRVILSHKKYRMH